MIAVIASYWTGVILIAAAVAAQGAVAGGVVVIGMGAIIQSIVLICRRL